MMTLASVFLVGGALLAFSAMMLLVTSFGRHKTLSGPVLDTYLDRLRAIDDDGDGDGDRMSEPEKREAERAVLVELLAKEDGARVGLGLPALARRPIGATMVLGAAIATIAAVALMGGSPRPAPALTKPSDPVSKSASAGAIDQPLDAVYRQLGNFARSSQAQPRVTAAKPAGSRNLPDVQTMIGRLAARLEKSPDDAEGWRMLGWSYFNTGAYAKAAEAYGRAIALKGDKAEWHAARGAALAKAASGKLTPDARKSFETALRLDPANRQAARFLGRPVTTTEAAGGDGDKPAAPGPTAADIRNARSMPAKERQAMIVAMVERLAERLKKSPKDADGWLRLIRSRTVLGAKAAARDDLRRAMEVFADDAATRARIAAAAKTLGVQAD